ncbi:hypothetical protein N9A89_01785 [Akkermansiaceae bacterium]|nr:hypothetical protein [Akkermansiaceae bacterium]MDB4421569.1 hypothetical protein [Akkermansiaceae bacterium]
MRYFKLTTIEVLKYFDGINIDIKKGRGPHAGINKSKEPIEHIK